MLVTNARDLKRAFGSGRGRLLAAARHFFANGGARLYLLGVADFEHDPEAAFARLDEFDDVSIVASPGHGSGATIEAGARYCERRAECFFLADSPPGAAPTEVRSLVEGLGVRSSYAALYMTTQWRLGAFQGAEPDEAYFVKCDRTTMTQADIDAGTGNVVVGSAPLKPAEFVVLRVGLKAARDDPDP